MKQKIQELRKAMPIPLSEAVQLLKENNEDIEKCIKIFKEKSIEQICELTGCDSKLAEQQYNAEKFDFNRTVSSIKELIYDQNYRPIDGLTKENIIRTVQWLKFIEENDFATSLDYSQFDVITNTLSLIPTLENIVPSLIGAKADKDVIFEGYTDSLSIDEFVRRHKRLDDSIAFQEASQIISLRTITIKEELMRHFRNL